MAHQTGWPGMVAECARKYEYSSEALALEAAERRSKVTGVRLYVYQCGAHWHLSKRPDRGAKLWENRRDSGEHNGRYSLGEKLAAALA